MDIEDTYRAFANTISKMNDAHDKSETQLQELRAMFNQLLEILIASGVLNAGHRRVFEKTAQYARRGRQPEKVHLRVVGDKYETPNSAVDCLERYHLCHGRCCSFTFALSRQDVEEGKVLWEIEDPYVIRHEEDGYCSHLDRDTLFCTVRENRPAACRSYDCRQDPRVWIDFEARIPAPMPEGVFQIRHRYDKK